MFSLLVRSPCCIHKLLNYILSVWSNPKDDEIWRTRFALNVSILGTRRACWWGLMEASGNGDRMSTILEITTCHKNSGFKLKCQCLYDLHLFDFPYWGANHFSTYWLTYGGLEFIWRKIFLQKGFHRSCSKQSHE